MEYLWEYLWIAILIVVLLVWGVFAIKDIYTCTHSILLRFRDIKLSTIIFLGVVAMLFAFSLVCFIALRG